MSAVPTTPPAASAAPSTTNIAAGASAFASNVAGASVASYTPPFVGVSSTSTSATPSSTAAPSAGNVLDNVISSWNKLSPTIHYAIYAGAGVLALLIIGGITWCCVARKRKQKAAAKTKSETVGNDKGGEGGDFIVNPSQHDKQAARLTGKSSFESPQYLPESSPSAAYDQAPPQFYSNAAYSNSTNSMDKSRFVIGNEDMDDARSVKTLPRYNSNYPPSSNSHHNGLYQPTDEEQLAMPDMPTRYRYENQQQQNNNNEYTQRMMQQQGQQANGQRDSYHGYGY